MPKTNTSKSRSQPLVEIPDLDSLPDIDPTKLREEKRPIRKPGFHWRGQAYKDEKAMIKAVTADIRKIVRERLHTPFDVVEADGASWSSRIRLVRLELETEGGE